MPSSPQTITTRGVFDYLESTAGKPIVGALVNCTLNFNGASVTSPIVNVGELQQSTTTDQNGFWRFLLVPNDTLTPTGTLYTISTPVNTYDISVPSGGADVQSSSILANTPSVLSPALTNLTGPITVTGNETVSGNLTVSGTTTLGSTTTGALTTAAETVGGDLTIASPNRLVFGAAAGKIVPGATSISHRNNADNADNLLIADAGAVTVRNGLTVSAGGATVTGTATVTGETSAPDFKATGVAALGSPLSGRFVGAWSTSGPPTGLTAQLNDYGFDSNGVLWVCTVAGTPGTWASLTGKLHAEVNQTAVQSVATGTTTVVSMDQVQSDPLVLWSTVNNRLTVPFAGRWRVSSTVTWATPTAKVNPLFVSVFKNAVEARRGSQIAPANGDVNPAVTVSAVIACAASDLLDIRVLQGAGIAYSTNPGIPLVFATFEFAGAP